MGNEAAKPINKQAKRLSKDSATQQAKRFSHSQASPSNDECVNDKQDKTSESEREGTQGRQEQNDEGGLMM